MASRPLLLDLFCGAGGAAMGYARAGFEVVGIDIKRQPRFPFAFLRASALDPSAWIEATNGRTPDVIHASPPCQHYSIATAGAGKAVRESHPALIDPTRSLLQASGAPYVIENVVLAPLIDPITVCGSSFPTLRAIDTDGQPLFLRRHRLFESSLSLTSSGCQCVRLKKHGLWIGGVYGGGRSNRAEARYVRRGGYTPAAAVRRELMGIDWMSQQELNESIPPAYTTFIGQQIMEVL